jgi:hypothetical protein
VKKAPSASDTESWHDELWCAEYIAQNAPSATDLDRKRWCDEFSQNPNSAMARLYTHTRLGISLWEGVDRVGILAKNLFEAISPAIDPRASDRDALVMTLEVCMALVLLGKSHGAALMERALFNCREAMEERDNGFDEPLLRKRPRSRHSSRQTGSEYHFKMWAGLIHGLLMSELGFKETEAANRVAKHIDDHNLLPRKVKGKCARSKSILNWHRSAMEEKDLFAVFLQVEYFRPHMTKAWELRDQGSRDAAAKSLLRVLTDLAAPVQVLQ